MGVQGWSLSYVHTYTAVYGLMGNLNKYDIKTAERCCQRRVTGRGSRPLSNQEEGKKNSRQPRPDTHGPLALQSIRVLRVTTTYRQPAVPSMYKTRFLITPLTRVPSAIVN